MNNYYDKANQIAEAINASSGALTRAELPEVNYLADGVYVRTLNIPAGIAMIGKIHKTKHVFALIQGVLNIADAKGSKQIKAPQFFVSEPGTQRTLYAVTDCMIMNAHACDTDKSIEEIENDLTTMDYKTLPNDVREAIEK